jgi:hypothetical protein
MIYDLGELRLEQRVKRTWIPPTTFTIYNDEGDMEPIGERVLPGFWLEDYYLAADFEMPPLRSGDGINFTIPLELS